MERFRGLSDGGGAGKLLSPARRRRCIDQVQDKLGVSERRVCRVLGQHRSTQRHVPRGREDEERLVADMVELARQYGRYGYRRIATLLRDAGWLVSDGRMERFWRREVLKVPVKQPKRGRLWLNDGSCVRLRPEHRNHVWSCDFVHCRTDDGRAFRTLNILDEFSRECRAIRVKRKLNSMDVIDVLTDLFILRGVPAFIRSDNGPEFVAQAVLERIRAIIRQVCAELVETIVKGVLSREHVHLMVSIPPHLAVSDMVRRLKGRSSHKVRREFPAFWKR